MSGYTPVFSSVFTGTLYGKWPDVGLWLCLLALANKHGEIDVTPQYIAGITGLTVEDVERCLDRFMQPDPRSRSETCDGRRLTLLDPSRSWGWRIVNFAKYREKARLYAKNEREVASGREAERKRFSREKDDVPPMSADVRRCPPLSDPSYTDTDTYKGDKKARKRAQQLPEGWKPKTDVRLDPSLKLPADFDVETELQKFIDHARSNGRAMVDWEATWRNWCRNSVTKGWYAKRQEGIRWV